MLKNGDNSYFFCWGLSTRYTWRWILLLINACAALFLFHVITSNKNYELEPISKYDEHSEPENKVQHQPVHKIDKKVLIYAATKFFGHPITTERFLAHCPNVQQYCRISSEFSDYENADGVVFHNADYSKVDSEKLNNLIKNRKPDVPFVIWTVESPSNDHMRPGKGVINWTMTYRMDSDIWAPYGKLEKLEKPMENFEEELEKIWSSKKKEATWLASNCWTQNRRTDLIRKMKDGGFDVEIWGNCGKQPNECAGVDNQESTCVLELLKPYKFYISIENSNCKDYVTEKFWKALGERQTIPIVLARKYYKALGVPDSAYIAVDDFPNLTDFVAHVKKVGESKELYLEYHKWRKDYRVFIGGGFSGFCSLCSKLRDPEIVNTERKVYDDVAKWHSFEMCDNSLANRFLK